MREPLDDMSKAIIEELQQDGRRSYASIGKAVGLSEAAVRQRVQRLAESGVMRYAHTLMLPDQPADRVERSRKKLEETRESFAAARKGWEATPSFPETEAVFKKSMEVVDLWTAAVQAFDEAGNAILSIKFKIADTLIARVATNGTVTAGRRGRIRSTPRQRRPNSSVTTRRLGQPCCAELCC